MIATPPALKAVTGRRDVDCRRPRHPAGGHVVPERCAFLPMIRGVVIYLITGSPGGSQRVRVVACLSRFD